VAQCVWWLASIIGLEQGLVTHIDNLQKRKDISSGKDQREIIHPDRIQQIQLGREVSSTPRDLTEDQRLDRILEGAEKVIQESFQDRTIKQRGRVNPLPTTKRQLKEAQKLKRRQEVLRKSDADRNKSF
jgi:hypothetical protein